MDMTFERQRCVRVITWFDSLSRAMMAPLPCCALVALLPRRLEGGLASLLEGDGDDISQHGHWLTLEHTKQLSCLCLYL